MEMTTVKTFAVMAVIFGCFAILYPKIFHPIVLTVFGSSQDSGEQGNRLPPHLKKPNMGSARPTPGGSPNDDIARHMRAGPHPGMRAAAEMQKQTNTQGSGGKGGGMMTVVLPMYAIGIIVYLVYTLSKVFGGRKKIVEDDEYVKRHFNKRQPLSDVRYDVDRKKFMYGEEDSEEEETAGIREVQRNRKQQKDLERLLFKADREKISDLEMRELKRRLLETESQMSRILQAMEEKVSDHVMDEEYTMDQEYDVPLEEQENTWPTRNPPQKSRKKEARQPGSNVTPRKRNVENKDGGLKGVPQDGEAEEGGESFVLRKDDLMRSLFMESGDAVGDTEDYSDDFEEQEVVEDIGAVKKEEVRSSSGLGVQMVEDYGVEESFETDSEESIPEEIDDFDGEEDAEVDEFEDESEDDNDGPTEAELLEKLNSKRGIGKTREQLAVGGEEVGEAKENEDDEYADVIDSDKEQELNQVHTDLRRRKKPPKENHM